MFKSRWGYVGTDCNTNDLKATHAVHFWTHPLTAARLSTFTKTRRVAGYDTDAGTNTHALAQAFDTQQLSLSGRLVYYQGRFHEKCARQT